MDEIKIKELWQASNDKLEQSLSLHKKNTEDITKLKVETVLSSMKPIKIFAIIVGLVWVGFGSVVLFNLFRYSYSITNPFFLYSATIQVLLTAIALIIYIYQLILLYQIDISEPVIDTQRRLHHLKISTLWVTRFLFLQLPVWTTFFLSKKMFVPENALLLTLNGLITLLFVFVAIYLFVNIRYENRNKQWFKVIFNGQEWTPILMAMEFHQELEVYKNE
jgi:hypothetical protein